MTNGLNDLLKENAEAAQYFSSLPDYIQDSVSDRADNITSMEELKDFADSLLENL